VSRLDLAFFGLVDLDGVLVEIYLVCLDTYIPVGLTARLHVQLGTTIYELINYDVKLMRDPGSISTKFSCNHPNSESICVV
jgi:hypothetical protein